jgi:hypothetical protein
MLVASKISDDLAFAFDVITFYMKYKQKHFRWDCSAKQTAYARGAAKRKNFKSLTKWDKSGSGC